MQHACSVVKQHAQRKPQMLGQPQAPTHARNPDMVNCTQLATPAWFWTPQQPCNPLPGNTACAWCMYAVRWTCRHTHSAPRILVVWLAWRKMHCLRLKHFENHAASRTRGLPARSRAVPPASTPQAVRQPMALPQDSRGGRLSSRSTINAGEHAGPSRRSNNAQAGTRRLSVTPQHVPLP